MFCTKNLAILLSFLKEFTESKKREKNVFSHNKRKDKKIACPDNDFLVVQAGYYVSQELFFRSIFQRCSQEVVELRN